MLSPWSAAIGSRLNERVNALDSIACGSRMTQRGRSFGLIFLQGESRDRACTGMTEPQQNALRRSAIHLKRGLFYHTNLFASNDAHGGVLFFWILRCRSEWHGWKDAPSLTTPQGEWSGAACGPIEQVPNHALENRNASISALLAYRFVRAARGGACAIHLKRGNTFRRRQRPSPPQGK